MADYKEHCDDCERALGNAFAHVHRWLDRFAKNGLAMHRAVCHHKRGVEDVRRMWGDQAAKAAEIHIRKDFGFIPTEEQAGKLCLFGPNMVPRDGVTFLTDEEAFR